MRRKLAALVAAFAAVAMALCLAGCQGGGQDKEPISVYLWSSNLLPEYAPYVQSQLPDLDIEWVVGANDLDFYKQLQADGELPDVITVRRFSLSDSQALQPHLMDLADTEVAAAYYTTYLESYRNGDGSVNWLPACGEIDGFLANKGLFDEHGIALPTDYASFVKACRAFEEKGVRGFSSDFNYDYTCMEVLQGLSIAELTSLDGRLWRAAYEAGEASLDDAIWPRAFERMERFIEDVGLGAEDTHVGYIDTVNDFAAGRVAIMRGTGVNLTGLELMGVEEVVFLPYFAEDAADNWVLTYPSFQVALSAELEQDPARKEAALRVLEVMMSDEAQNVIAPSCAITYSREVGFEPSEDIESVVPYIESNHLYIRLASNDFFSASHEVVTKMLTGDYDAKAAYEAMDALLAAPDAAEEAAFACEVAADYAFSPDGGNPAQSAVANTVREIAGADLLLSPFTLACRPICEGDYTLKELGYVIASNTPCVFTAKLTGAEVRELVRASVEDAGLNIPAINRNTLPVSSGFEMQVRETEEGFVLEGVTVGGQPLDDEATYTLAYVNNASAAANDAATALRDKAAIERFEGNVTPVRQLWTDYLTAGNQPAAPTPYLTLG